METLLIPLTLALGALLAVQAGANLQLAAAMRSPIGASTAQLAVGTVALVALAAVAGTLGAVGLLPDAEPWHLAGGFASALYITAGILLFPRLGALTAVGLFIAGQMLTSLLVDGLGLLGVARQPLGAGGVLGGMAVLGGALAITRAGGGGDVAHRGAWTALGLLAGAGLGLQGPVNAQLRSDLDAPVTAGAFSFLVATAAMAVVLTAWQAAGRAGRPRAPHRSMPWWGWLGGLVGAAYVTSVPLLIGEIGAAATLGLTVAGQQLASLAVDRFGLLRLPRRPVTAGRRAGVALLLAGVALIGLA
jgi:bacterial/archaeal transporter family-2 protein